MRSLSESMSCSRLDGTCVKNCKEGFYSDESHECEPCHHECRSCGGPYYDDCDSCEDGMRLLNGQCVSMNKKNRCDPSHFLNGKAPSSFSLI